MDKHFERAHVGQQLIVAASFEPIIQRSVGPSPKLAFKAALATQSGKTACACEPIRLDKQFCFHRRCIPDPGGNEVVQLIVFAERKPLRRRLNALAIARTDQPRHLERTHLSPRPVTQPIEKRLEKASKLYFPIRRPANHGLGGGATAGGWSKMSDEPLARE